MMTMLTAAFQDSGGVFEISQRMTSLLRWGATSDFQDDGVYNQAVESYVLDTEMANTLKEVVSVSALVRLCSHSVRQSASQLVIHQLLRRWSISQLVN